MTVIEAALVERWTQDPPAITRAEAFLAITADFDGAAAGFADAELIVSADFLLAADVLAEAVIDPDAVIAVRVAVIGDASAAIESSAQSIDVNLTAGPALVPISATATVVVPVDADAVFAVLDASVFAPSLLGSATVTMVDLGQGSVPLFPFEFPTRFTDNPLGIQDALAVVVVTGSSDDVAAGGFADAVVRIVDTGGTFPYYFPIQFEGLVGNTPIFPFVFPAIFTDQANGRLASAVLTFEGAADTEVSVLAIAEAAITATASRVSPAFFPFVLPAQFV